jgi:hypothetical protein
VVGSNYEVVVKGRLSPTLLSAIDGFKAIRKGDGSTHLVGWIIDQSRYARPFRGLTRPEHRADLYQPCVF